ncbi:MAG: hypothetical protein AMXMBFR84_25120 [Candidatus Hydrogenedentota bacterium]
MITGERLMVPEWGQPAFTWIFRVLYFVHLPAVLLIQTIWPQAGGHPPWESYLVSCMSIPFIYWAAIRLLWRLYTRFNEPGEIDAGRRLFLARSAGGAVALTGSGLGTYGVIFEPNQLRVRRYTIGIRDLPLAMDGMRLLQISDTHCGPMMSMSFLHHVIDQANRISADAVLLTGDYVHRTPMAVEPGIGLFNALRSRCGAVAVLGNHDHWEGKEACVAMFKQVGIPLIDNRRVYLSANGFQSEYMPDSICVAGVGDLWCDDVLMSEALAGVPLEMPRILLSHNPDVAETMDAQHRVDLMISGHTHGGQVRLPLLGTPIVPSRYGSKYAGGLCRGPRCRVLVSRGVGIAVLPVRFRVPPEIGLITLQKEQDSGQRNV